MYGRCLLYKLWSTARKNIAPLEKHFSRSDAFFEVGNDQIEKYDIDQNRVGNYVIGKPCMKNRKGNYGKGKNGNMNTVITRIIAAELIFCRH